jgi:hypothetical protein
MRASRISLLMQLLSRLGLDPQARTRLQTEAPAAKPASNEPDEWQQFETIHKSQRSTRPM